jgi:hypothetical protein
MADSYDSDMAQVMQAISYLTIASDDVNTRVISHTLETKIEVAGKMESAENAQKGYNSIMGPIKGVVSQNATSIFGTKRFSQTPGSDSDESDQVIGEAMKNQSHDKDKFYDILEQQADAAVNDYL